MSTNGKNTNTTVHYGGPGKGDNVQVHISTPSKAIVKSSELSTKNRFIPIYFERAAGNWFNPRFDSDILEDENFKTYFPQTKKRFQYALIYIMVACIFWGIFFALMQQLNWIYFLIGCLVVFALAALTLCFTYTKFYERFYVYTSVLISLLLCIGILIQFSLPESNMSSVALFTASVEILILIYTFIPMPLYVVFGIGITHSILFEVLTFVVMKGSFKMSDNGFRTEFIVGKALLHLCIHSIGFYIFIMSHIRKRSTFWKIGQSVMARRDLALEKQLREKMIHSLMPKSVADEVMKSREDKRPDDDMEMITHSNSQSRKERGEIIFRTFNMNSMDDVSILFADIVGFTKMSSNKTAERLVGLLNDLFGRFDDLCTKSGCEKISTLGDCYYCVSGCPESRPDHARCCVEMGLGMIKAIEEFDEEHNESVNMRVGVHTGTVLCGIVGTRRFKFDVWSNDVTLANTMESTGKPGKVHISAASLAFLKDEYEVEEGEDVQDNRTHKVLIEHYNKESLTYQVEHREDEKVIKTYFINGRKNKGDAGAEGNATESDAAKRDSATVSVDMGPDADNPTPATELLSKSRKDDCRDLEGAAEANHLDSKGVDVNGVSPAALLGRRHSSGFYATSELSLNMIGSDADQDENHIPINETWKRVRKVHEQTDLQIIKCIKEDVTNKEFFYKPPVNPVTLNFSNPMLEENYKDHYLEEEHMKNTLSSPGYQALLEVIVSLVIFTLITICCFIIFDREIPWILVFVVSLIIEILVLAHAISDVKCRKQKKRSCDTISHFLSGWYFRNFIGAVMVMIPIAAIYSNMSCDLFSGQNGQDRFLCYAIMVALVHYCNFTMLSSWMKSILAVLSGIILLILLALKICEFGESVVVTMPTVVLNMTVDNETKVSYGNNTDYIHLFSGAHQLRWEIILDMFLLLFLVWFLNREFEISYRLSFHGDAQARADKQQMQINKEQADWLLHNIIPDYISDQLKETSKYSKNHKDVGVIFATLVNFNEFYDEAYQGGREYLRVLNELVSDYEDLLDENRFRNVEKIKTITSCFMAASGLNEQVRSQNKHPYAHLFALMEFCQEMQEVVRKFNESIFNFSFELNIGYNYGEVTAGVIGTTKLLYDIWGDTVNIASRMYSTGVKDKVQVPEASANLLSEMFDFEYRGTISVKGKGEMKTYLLVDRKEGATWE